MIELLAKLYQNRYVVVIGAIVLLCVSFYLYHLRATIKIERLETENAKLEDIVTRQSDALVKIEQNYKEIISAKDEMQKELHEIQERHDTLVKTIYRENRRKKSIEELARKKTSLIEKKINKATDNVLKCFETLSRGGAC